MIRFLFRFAATLALAAAVVMAVLDATRTVAAKTVVLTPLMTSWQATCPEGPARARQFIEQRLSAVVWDPRNGHHSFDARLCRIRAAGAFAVCDRPQAAPAYREVCHRQLKL